MLTNLIGDLLIKGITDECERVAEFTRCEVDIEAAATFFELSQHAGDNLAE